MISCRPKHLLPVLNVQERKNVVEIQFNAVIPLNIWEFEVGKSSVYVRFSNEELGGWKRDIGPCTYRLVVLCYHLIILFYQGCWKWSLCYKTCGIN